MDRPAALSNKFDVDAFTGTPCSCRGQMASRLVNPGTELAITASTPDPEEGAQRDLDGTPTAVLANAMNVFRDHPPETDDYIKDNLERGLQANAALGWTQTHDAGMAFRLTCLKKSMPKEWRIAPLRWQEAD